MKRTTKLKASIEAAGFRLTDVLYLLNNMRGWIEAREHGAFESVGGAQLVASQPNAVRWRGVDEEEFCA